MIFSLCTDEINMDPFEDSFNAALANIDVDNPIPTKQAKSDTVKDENNKGDSSNKPKVNKSHCILVSPKQVIM